MSESASSIQVEKYRVPRGFIGLALVGSALAVLCFLVTPLTALLWRALPGFLNDGLSPLAVGALRLSLLTSLATTAIAVLIGVVGINRKFGFWGYFFASLLLTPFVGILLVLVSDKRPIDT